MSAFRPLDVDAELQNLGCPPPKVPKPPKVEHGNEDVKTQNFGETPPKHLKYLKLRARLGTLATLGGPYLKNRKILRRLVVNSSTPRHHRSRTLGLATSVGTQWLLKPSNLHLMVNGC